MEEQKKENLPENTEAENSLEDTSEAQKAAQPAGRSFLWMLAGVYLLYTGYSLAAAVIRGEEGATPFPADRNRISDHWSRLGVYRRKESSEG